MKKILLAALAFLAVFSVVSAASAADLVLRQDFPARDWESQYFPIGNGSLGAMLNGGIVEDELQLNLDSLWSGRRSNDKRDDNPDANYADMGNYLPLGTMIVKFDGVRQSEVKNYTRTLNISDAVHTVQFETSGGRQTREAFASYPDKVIVYRVTSATPFSGSMEYHDGREGLKLSGTTHVGYWLKEGYWEEIPWNHYAKDDKLVVPAPIYRDGAMLFAGLIPHDLKDQNVLEHYRDHTFVTDKWGGMRYQVRAKLLADGTVEAAEDRLVFRDCRTLTILFSAESDYLMPLDFDHWAIDYKFLSGRSMSFLESIMSNGGYSVTATPKLQAPQKRVDAAEKLGYDELKKRHVADHRSLFDRVKLDLGGDPALERLTLAERVRRCHEGKTDPALVALMFQYGRYLLIASSRPGSLPANLQGIWNNSNTPAWHSDYHTNINLQMNYWGAEPANLAECHEPLFDLLFASVEGAYWDTRTVQNMPNDKLDNGFTFRTSMNIYGAGGWRWNWPSSAWFAQHFYRHWQYGRDINFLYYEAWPYYMGVAEFWFRRLKKRDDGTLVVPQGWSPEHGPVEDGVAHDQQIVAEFFDQYIDIITRLKIGKVYRYPDQNVEHARDVREHLLGNKIGSWGQLQEWETDRDVKGDEHRHTSHLFAVYPGSSIDAVKTPELFKAARVSLEGRALTGDARRSWTWPWRAALWARLGDGKQATDMVNSLLRYNTLENLFTTHPPFQIDGNLGIVGAMCEMFVQNDSGGVFLLPVDLPDWPDGSFSGLRVYGGFVVSAQWKQGRLVRAEIKAVRSDTLKLRTRTPMVWSQVWPQYRLVEGTEFTIPMRVGETAILTAP